MGASPGRIQCSARVARQRPVRLWRAMPSPGDTGQRALDSALRSFWHPVAWVDEVGSAPVSSELLGEALVIWRAEDEVVVAIDRCPHRGTKLSLGEVREGALVCPYHGWWFGPTGSCERIPQLASDSPIPARATLELLRSAERYGIVWTALEEPVALVPDFPEWDDPAYVHEALSAYTWQAGAGRMLENFIDLGHRGYLHGSALDDLAVPGHRVHAEGLTLAYEISMAAPYGDADLSVGDPAADRNVQTNSYEVTLPFSVHLRCSYEESDKVRTMFFAVQPRSDVESTGYCYQSRNFDLDADPESHLDRQELLVEQDRPIVESQLPKGLPLGATDELHLGFDRVAVAYRRQLRKLLSEMGSTP